MRTLESELAKLEQSLRSEGKSEMADFFRALLKKLESARRDAGIVLERLVSSAAMAQYGGFTATQEALHLWICEKACEINASAKGPRTE